MVRLQVMVGAAPAGRDLINKFLGKFPHVKFVVQGGHSIRPAIGRPLGRRDQGSG